MFWSVALSYAMGWVVRLPVLAKRLSFLLTHLHL